MKIRSLSVLILPIAVSRFANAQDSAVEKAAISELPSLLSIYKDIHAHPELSGHEEKTAALVAKELRAAGCEVIENFGKYDDPRLKCYGVVGVMKNGNGPTVLVRTDMDALPVHEETGLPYASTVTTKNDEGREVSVMHACGHDAHMAAFIGTARALQRMKDNWSGTLIFVGQPAEEAIGGARAMLKAGLYNRFGKPDFALEDLRKKTRRELNRVRRQSGWRVGNAFLLSATVDDIGDGWNGTDSGARELTAAP